MTKVSKKTVASGNIRKVTESGSNFGARFGVLVRRRRGLDGLTLEQLAHEAFGEENKKTRISELENGKIKNPQAKTIDALVFALRITDEELEACRNPPGPVQARAASERHSALTNIPIRVPVHFLGRDEALEAIDKGLSRDEGRVAITALHGLRGVGKTTLAAAYAERKRADYRATWWIRAQSPDGMRADLVALGVRLGWLPADAKDEPSLPLVMERLVHEGEGILLIYDNAIDNASLRPFLPKGGKARVLVTSNFHAWRGLAEPVEIRLWPKAIGADYLVARTGRTAERLAAEALSEALGGLPLAHEQATAYCERLSVPLAAYLERFKAQPEKLLDDIRHASSEYHDGRTVAKTFSLAISEASKLHPAAEPLLELAAILPPEPIPLFLFAEGWQELDDPLRSLLTNDGLDEALAALGAFALVGREELPDERDATISTPCFHLHRLVRQVASPQVDETARKASLLRIMSKVYPYEGVFRDPAAWIRCRRLDKHIVALTSDSDMFGVEAQFAKLLGGLGGFRQEALAAYSSARPLLERSLTICESASGPDHPDTAASRSNLAVLYQQQGEFALARLLHERALAARETALGPDHPATAETLSNLAVLLRIEGNPAASRPLLARALAIREKAFGPNHPDTAGSLNNLAVLLETQGEFAAALPLQERTLAICEATLGPEHPTTGMSLNNLARLLERLGDKAAAKQHYERSLAIKQKAFGSDHPSTAVTKHNLAGLLRQMGQLAAAQTLYESALAIQSRVHGDEHHITNVVRASIANLELAAGRPREALRLGEIALANQNKALGIGHDWTKDCARVTANALEALDRTEDATILREKYGLQDKP